MALIADLPIGSVSILTIQRAMSLGFRRAYLPTLGATMGSTVFGVLAALGSGYLSNVIAGGEAWLRLLAGVILIFIGTKMLTYRSEGPEIMESFGVGQLAFFKFTLVITNPLTLAFYTAAFAAFGLESSSVFTWQSLVLGGGILTGTVVWFLLICTLASRFYRKLSNTILMRIRKGVGIIIVILGLVSAITFLLKV